MCQLKTAIVAIVIAIAFLSARALIADAPPVDPNAFKPQIDDAQNNVQIVKTALGGLMDYANQAPLFTKQDQVLISADVQKEIDAWSAVADAWRSGDQATAQKLDGQAREFGSHRGVWQTRLDIRQRESREAPSEDAMNQMCGWRNPAGVALFFEAKKKLAEACDRMANAMIPGADPKLLAELDDQVYAAQIDADVAQMWMSWMSDDHGYAMRDAVSSPGLTEAQKALDDFRKHHVAMYRKIHQEQRDLDQYDKQYGPLGAARDNEAEKARQLRDHPPQ